MSEKAKKKEPSSLEAFRACTEEISEHTIPMLHDLNARIDQIAARIKGLPAPKDPRREPEDDPRKEDDIPEDVVMLPVRPPTAPEKKR
jgi:hypothetical protein